MVKFSHVVCVVYFASFIRISSTTALVACNFNSNLCGWWHDNNARLRWTRQSGDPYAGLGSTTLDSGYYASVNISADSVKGDRATMESRKVIRNRNLCLRFWFGMITGKGAKLKVYVRNPSGVRKKKKYFIWKRSGRRNIKWRLVNINLKKRIRRKIRSYVIGFQGITGGRKSDLIGIDDVLLAPCSGAYDCNFDDSTCGWMHDDTANFRWRRRKGKTPSGQTGPNTDHSGKGYYMYIEASKPRVLNDTARLESMTIKRNPQMCLSFWYHMYGHLIGTLRVYVRLENRKMVYIWKKSRQQGKKWIKATVDLRGFVKRSKRFLVGFEGVRGYGYHGDIAIDDIKFSKCTGKTPTKAPGTTSSPAPSTPSVLFCDFNKDFCGWTHDKNSNFFWNRTKGSLTGLKQDVSGDGSYIYIKASHTRRIGDIARLESPIINTNESKCLNFWYHTKGDNSDKLTMYVREEVAPMASRQNMFMLFVPDRDSWFLTSTPLRNYTSRLGNYVLGIEGMSTKNQKGYVALDDISIVTCSDFVSCDFENGTCGWSNKGAQDNIKWKRTKKPTGPNAPKSDHTGNGYYMYISKSKTKGTSGDIATMESPTVATSDNLCLNFWYYKYGTAGGDLRVYVRSSVISKNQTKVSLRKLVADGEKKWYSVSLPLDDATSQTGTFVIGFVGRMGTNTGVIAVDDVKTQTCAADTYDCDFDTSTCGWLHDDKSNFRWVRQKGSVTGGPKADHGGNGYYMFISASGSMIGKSGYARLESPRMSASSPRCFTFWYYMHSSNAGTLRIYLKLNTNVRKDVWKRSNDQGNVWNKGSVYLGNYVTGASRFLLTVEGTRSGIAIDDVKFVSCSAIPDLTTPTIPPPTKPAEKGSLSCDFNTNMCGWRHDDTANFKWSRSNGKKTKSPRTGPYESASRRGYAYIEASKPRKLGDKARLESPVISGSLPKCLGFMYHMYGRTIGSLNVYVKAPTDPMASRKVVFTRKGQQGHWWTYTNVILQPYTNGMSDYIVGFEGVRGKSFTGDIAIDDVNILNCSDSYNCDFDKSMCGYTHSNNTMNWKRWNGKTTSKWTGPNKDVSGNGYYMYVEASIRFPLGRRARLESPTIPSTANKCLTFWYHMYGRHIGTLNVYVTTKSLRRKLIWSVSKNKGRKWLQATIDLRTWIKQQEDFVVMFEGVLGSKYMGDIAIDQIKFNKCAAPLMTTVTSVVRSTTPPIPNSLTCTFAKNFCGWSHDNKANFRWKRSRGTTKTRFTGPVTDRTGGGYYIYIEASRPRVPGDVARLESPAIPANRSLCVQFWYHMYGRDIGQLLVYLRALVAPMSQRHKIWSRTGHQGRRWRRASLDISNFTSSRNTYVVGFEGVRGSSYRGDMALDDLKVIKCTPQGYDCNFDLSFCSWSHDESTGYRWRRQKGPTKSKKTGPKGDHTGNGYYIYLESSRPMRPWQKTRLESDSIIANRVPRCLSFWYHMYGRDVNRLSVQITTKSARRRTIWKLSGSQGDRWIHQIVDLRRVTSGQTQYNVAFEATRGRSYKGDIALDDISFVKCQGTPMPTTPGTSITPGPAGALQCNFDKNFCGWRHDDAANFKWTLQKGATKTSWTGPSRDHTSGKGMYAYIEASPPRIRGDKARLQGPVISDKNMCLSFWFHMYGSGIGSLIVAIKSPTAPMSQRIGLVTFSGSHGNKWRLFRIQFDKQRSVLKEFVVVFEGVRGNRYSGDIAIDDVSIKKCTDVNLNIAINKTVTAISMGSGRRPSLITDGDVSMNKPTDCYWSGRIHKPWVMVDLGMLYNISNIELYFPYGFIEDSYMRNSYFAGRIPNFRLNSGFEVFLSTSKHWDVRSNLCFTHKGSAAPIELATCTAIGRYVIVRLPFANSDTQLAICELRIYGVKMPAGVTFPTPKTPVLDGDCNFDFGTCGYSHDEKANFRWMRHFGQTSSSNTGPTSDHTGNGYYMYIESSMPRKAGEKARLQTPLLQKSTKTCLSFWYNMKGKSIGVLRVFIQMSYDKKRLVWTKRGSQGGAWLQAIIDLRMYASLVRPFRVIFEGERGLNYFSDIAIDDVSFTTCVGIINCDFEADLCGMENDDDADHRWLRHRGKTPSSGTGPNGDHTTGVGWYLYIEATAPDYGDVARIETVPTSNNKSLCMTFWYNMNGIEIESLIVYAKNKLVGNRRVMANITGNQGRKWLNMTIGLASYVYNMDYYVIGFEAIRGKGYKGDIAIDDISVFTCTGYTWMTTITPLSTPSTKPVIFDKKNPYGCDFDQSECQLKHDNKARLRWRRQDGKTASPDTGPSSDHSGSGYYMYVEASKAKVKATAHLETPVIPSLDLCLTFWYHMKGSGVGVLMIHTITAAVGKVNIVNVTSSQDDAWKQKTIQIRRFIPPSVPYKIVFEGVRGKNYKGDIAIDDIVFKNCSGLPNCNFNKDLCGWINDKGADFSWTRHTGRTKSLRTGPKTDHTGTGFYMYIESSKPRIQGEIARLISPLISTTANINCVEFWYHMWGNGVGRLSFFISDATGSLSLVEWVRNGEQSMNWLSARVYIGDVIAQHNFTVFYVGFTGRIGNTFRGDIAIDDIKFITCKPSKTTPMPKTTKKPGKVLACDFDKDFCDWKKNPRSDFSWTRLNKKTFSHNTGPKFDHSGNGSYIYIETSSPRVRGDRALLESPIIQTPITLCIDFWYHMHGTDIGTLNVYMNQPNSDDSTRISLWNRTGGFGDIWRHKHIKLNNDLFLSGNYIVGFEGVVGPGYKGDLAVDDVNFTDCGVNIALYHPTDAISHSNSRYPVDNDGSTCFFSNNLDYPWWQVNLYATHTIESVALVSQGGLCSAPVRNVIQKNTPCYLLNSGYEVYVSSNKTSWKRPENLCYKHVGNASITEHHRCNLLMSGKYITIYLPFANSLLILCEVKVYGHAYDFPVIAKNPSDYGCDFDTSMCGWNNVVNSSFYWTRNRGKTPSIKTGPKADMSGNGAYMFIEATSPRKRGDKARLESELIVSNETLCLSFWYHMYGAGTGTLNLYIRRPGSSKANIVIWTKSGDQGNQWLHATLNLFKFMASSKYIYVGFEGIRGKNFKSDIAIDQITFQICRGQNLALKKSTSDNAKTYPGRAVDGKNLYDPVSSCYYSGYMPVPWWRVDLGRRSDINAIDIYHSFALCSGYIENKLANGPFPCWMVNTGYEIYISESLNNWRNQSNLCFRSRNITMSNETVRCHKAMSGRYVTILLPFANDQTELILCQVEVFGWYADTTPTPSATVRPTTKGLPLCGFEKDFCGWRNTHNNTYKWLRKKGSTVTILTGPSTDHSGNGYYIYAEASAPSRYKDKAGLISPLLSMAFDNPLCVSYWFHMYGRDINELNVAVKSPSELNSTGLVILKHKRNHNDSWHFASTSLNYGTNPLYIEFVAVRGTSYRGDVALDDVTVYPCKSVTGSPTRSFLSTKTPAQSFGCDFEVNFCAWSHNNNANFRWWRRKGKTPTSHTGPLNSPKGKAYYYVYIESSFPQRPNDNAMMTSPNITNTEPYCLQFYYHMYGRSIGRLNIYVFDILSRKVSLKMVWSAAGNKGNQWYSTRIDLSSFTTSMKRFVVSFEGVRGKSYHGDIAVDDITIMKCASMAPYTSLPTVITVTSTPQGRTCGKLVGSKVGTITPKTCTTAPSPVNTACLLTCPQGYVATGQPKVTCLSTGMWSGSLATSCNDLTPPKITCPKDISVTTSAGQTSTKVSWSSPTATDNSGKAPKITQSMISPATLNVGVYQVTATATDAANRVSMCTFSITVKGSSSKKSTLLPPPVFCPGLTAPAHGSLATSSCSKTQKKGSVCAVTCASGYQLIGLSHITCLSSGVWSGTAKCQDVERPKIKCRDITATATKGKLTATVSWTKPKVTDNSGTVSRITQNRRSPFKAGDGAYPVIVSASDASDNRARCMFYITIKVLRCGAPVVGELYTLKKHCDGYYGEVCQVKCIEGYTQTGSGMITCEKYGKSMGWTSLKLSCAKGNVTTSRLTGREAAPVSESARSTSKATIALVVVIVIMLVAFIVGVLAYLHRSGTLRRLMRSRQIEMSPRGLDNPVYYEGNM